MSPPAWPGGATSGPPALPGSPLACGADATGEGALAYAPDVTTASATATPDVLAQDALPVVIPEDPRTQLERVMSAQLADAVIRGARRFDADVGDGRTMDALTLGLLWKAEGGAQLSARLDPDHDNFGDEHWRWIDALVDLRPAGLSEFRRAWRISNIGLWSFGLDDLFKLVDGQLGDLDMDASLTRWQARLREHADWTGAVPYAGTIGETSPRDVQAVVPVDVRFSTNEAVGFLVAMAARFTKQLWLLPDELDKRGLVLARPQVQQIPQAEPILAYMCYLQRADRAAALWEALLFLLQFGSAVSLARPASFEPQRYALHWVIDVLNRWLGPLRDDGELGLPATLFDIVKDSTARIPDGRLGRDVLADIAARADWDPIPAEASLDAEGRALLDELVDAWAVYAERMDTLPRPVTPGSLFFDGADGSVAPLLVPNTLGTVGFGARNYGRRFLAATKLPLGEPCARVVATAAVP